MSFQNEVKANLKDLKGKVQEAVGEVTEDPAAKAAGQAKQVEADIMRSTEAQEQESADKN
ncbi:MAG: CsbD family protein [Cyanobacteria bacterium J06626_18]